MIRQFNPYLQPCQITNRIVLGGLLLWALWLFWLGVAPSSLKFHEYDKWTYSLFQRHLKFEKCVGIIHLYWTIVSKS